MRVAQCIDVVVGLAQRGIAAGGYPGAAVVVGRRGAAVWEKGFGRLGWEKTSPWVSTDRTIYDLASLTKVVGTTTALMVLYDEGKIRRFVNVFVADEDIRFLQGPDTPVDDKTTISIIPAVAGG